MAKAPTQQTGQFEFRVGLNDFAYGGMMQDPDEGAIPPNRLRFVRNGRYQGGGIVSRPPYELVIPVEKFVREAYVDGTLTPSYGYWDLQYFTEHHPAFPVRVWYSGRGTSYGNGGTGGFVGFVDIEADPMVQPVGAYPQVVSRTPSIAKFDGEIYVGEYGFLRKVYQIKTPSGVTPIDYGSLPADDIIWNFGAAFVDVLHTHLGKLYMLVVDPLGATNSVIYSWDGATLATELDLGASADSGAAAISWRDQLIFACRGLGLIHIRAADGTWSTATCADFEVSGSKNAMAADSFGVHIVDGNDKLFLWDGTSLALESTLLAPYERMCVCAEVGGFIYVGGSAQVGGGPTWRHAIFGCGVFDQPLLYFTPDCAGYVSAMCSYGGRLVVAYGGDYIKTHPVPYQVVTGPPGLSEEMNGWFGPSSYHSAGGDQYYYTSLDCLVSG